MNVILASSSPRRKIILQSLIDKFEIYSPGIKEAPLPAESPQQFAERVSEEKAKSIVPFVTDISESLIISCDTIVNINNQIIGKPVDFQDAVSKIQILNGKTHEVISSITLLCINGGQIINTTESEISRVTFKNITNNEIINYLKKFDFKDKAGAYAAQEFGDLIIKSIEGSATNVVGFPLRLFFKMLCRLNLFDKIFL